MKKWKLVVGLLLMVLAAGCGGSGGTTDDPDDPDDPVNPGSLDDDVVGDWRILSEMAYFDNGQTSTITPVSTLLVLDSDGTWEFGSSSGSASVEDIDDADWTYWDIDPYEATRKLVLDDWNDDEGKGPIDEGDLGVDNLWVVYDYESDDNGPGKIWMKFGAAE